MNPDQIQMVFVDHQIENNHIQQRLDDGYINATAMCKAADKRWSHYRELSSTNDYLKELSSAVGIPVDGENGLIKQIIGGIPDLQGTWVHPQVAVHLAQWLSPKFAVMVSQWVYEWMTGGIKKYEMPPHIKRYISNRSKIPPTHFSMLNELIFNLVAPMESDGYILPEVMMPDISTGRMFCKWLRDQGYEPDDFPTYTHDFEDGRSIPGVKLYPNEVLAAFRKYFNETWLPEKSIPYFEPRDKEALKYLPKLLESNTRLSDHNKKLKQALDYNPDK